jgi:hypothetical protein
MRLKPSKVVFHTSSKNIGLGDAVEAIAKPIARTIDALTGSKIQECGGCQKRKDSLNRVMPNISNPFSK